MTLHADPHLALVRPVQPLTERHPGLSLQQAYQVQQWNVAARVRAGERVLGHKAGQQQAEGRTPDEPI